jgi:integrase
LWDSGFRISELLALRIESFRLDADGKGARLVLPHDAPDLKTGPRTIYVIECVDPIRAWLSLHSQRDNPKAVLFPAFNKLNNE